MNKKTKNILLSVIAVIIIAVGYLVFPDMGTTPADTSADTYADTYAGIAADTVGISSDEKTPQTDPLTVTEDGKYLSKDDVAAYIHAFGKLPENFITKSEAEDLGWVSSEGNLWDVADGYAIGGDRFGNYEGLLPEADGRQYYECDVNYNGGYRGGERIVFSNDGLIFYTSDHYESFTQLYGE